MSEKYIVSVEKGTTNQHTKGGRLRRMSGSRNTAGKLTKAIFYDLWRLYTSVTGPTKPASQTLPRNYLQEKNPAEQNRKAYSVSTYTVLISDYSNLTVIFHCSKVTSCCCFQSVSLFKILINMFFLVFQSEPKAGNGIVFKNHSRPPSVCPSRPPGIAPRYNRLSRANN